MNWRYGTRKRGPSTYKNSWITDKELREENVKQIAECGRTRWKLENEYNNVLKNRGYNLKHNFGHGKEHASELFCLLNVLSYLIHGIQDVADEEYRKARGSFGRRDAFFWALRYEMSRYLHDDWTDFLLTIAGEAQMILEFGIAVAVVDHLPIYYVIIDSEKIIFALLSDTTDWR